MAAIPIQDKTPPAGTNSPKWALFALGFRPFFLLAMLMAPALVLLWVWAFSTGSMPDNYFGAANWHAHEMLLGYTTAVIAGFLLTAVGNWTGQSTLNGKPLAAFALLWIAGRIVSWTTLPPLVIAVIELSWLPLLTIALLLPIVRARHWKSLAFPLMVSVLFVANLLTHLEHLGIHLMSGRDAIQIALVIVLVMITVMGGRVIPFFSERGVEGLKTDSLRWIELTVVPVTLLYGISVISGVPDLAVAIIALSTAVLHGVRFIGWYDKRIWREPMVWVLHLGYGWMPVGFLLATASHAGQIPTYVPLHAFTAGTISILTVGMMARVILGHTGRNVLEPPKVAPIAFGLLTLAATIRVFLPWLLPKSYALWIGLSGCIFGLAFVLMVMGYASMLLRPRIDGQPG